MLFGSPFFTPKSTFSDVSGFPVAVTSMFHCAAFVLLPFTLSVLQRQHAWFSPFPV